MQQKYEDINKVLLLKVKTYKVLIFLAQFLLKKGYNNFVENAHLTPMYYIYCKILEGGISNFFLVEYFSFQPSQSQVK